MAEVAIRPTHSAPQPISTCSEASLIILYPPLAFAARAAAPSLAHLMIAAAVERGASTCPIHSGCQLLDPVVADALSHPFSIRLFAALVAAAAAAPAERLACAHVLLADTSSCTDRGGSAADGCDSGSSPGRADSPRVFKLFSMIVGSMQVRSSSASRRSPCASPLLRPFSSVAHQTCHS